MLLTPLFPMHTPPPLPGAYLVRVTRTVNGVPLSDVFAMRAYVRSHWHMGVAVPDYICLGGEIVGTEDFYALVQDALTKAETAPKRVTHYNTRALHSADIGWYGVLEG